MQISPLAAACGRVCRRPTGEAALRVSNRLHGNVVAPGTENPVEEKPTIIIVNR